MSEDTPTRVTIDCPCPPLADGAVRHPDGDTVTLREHLDFRAGMTARNSVALARESDPGIGAAEILTLITEIYILHGVEAWTLVDEKGKALEVTRPNIRAMILGDQARALIVGDAGDDLYAAAVMLPLLETEARSSRGTPTERSTSPTSGKSHGPRPRPSKRSSTFTTQTDGIAPMSASPDGGFNSSPR